MLTAALWLHSLCQEPWGTGRNLTRFLGSGWRPHEPSVWHFSVLPDASVSAFSLWQGKEGPSQDRLLNEEQGEVKET